MKIATLLCLLLVIVAVFAVVRGEEVEEKPKKKRTGNKWKDITVEEIEKAWEEGDAETELEDENARLEKIRIQKRPKFDMNDKESLKRAYKKDPSTFGSGGQAAAGTAMLFVDISKKKNGEDRSEKEIRTLASKWTSMLQAGGLLTQLYHPGNNVILIHIERGWLTKEVMHFVSMQREVETFTLNQKKFTPKEYLASLEDDDDL